VKRLIIIVVLAIVGLVPAMAAPALAGTAGAVYGQATLEPYALVISGGGVSVDTALGYSGSYGTGAHLEDLGRAITVTNAGTETCDFTMAGDQQPTNGAVTWTFGHDSATGWVDTPGPDAAVWTFSPQAGKTASDFGVGSIFTVPVRETTPRTIATGVPSGDSVTFDSTFEFPTTSSGAGTFEMSAVVSAIAQ
jgi:hypothetical protein